MKTNCDVSWTFTFFFWIKFAFILHFAISIMANLDRSHITDAKVLYSTSSRKTATLPRGAGSRKDVATEGRMGYRGRSVRQRPSHPLPSMQETRTREVELLRESRHICNRARGRGVQFVTIANTNNRHRLAMRGENSRKNHEKKLS
jgi:hypothetical protein